MGGCVLQLLGQSLTAVATVEQAGQTVVACSMLGHFAGVLQLALRDLDGRDVARDAKVPLGLA